MLKNHPLLTLDAVVKNYYPPHPNGNQVRLYFDGGHLGTMTTGGDPAYWDFPQFALVCKQAADKLKELKRNFWLDEAFRPQCHVSVDENTEDLPSFAGISKDVTVGELVNASLPRKERELEEIRAALLKKRGGIF